MQTLTKLLLQESLTRPIVSDTQIARVVEDTTQRRYNLVNRASKGGELYRLPRGLHFLELVGRVTSEHQVVLIASPTRARDCFTNFYIKVGLQEKAYAALFSRTEKSIGL